jgi:hypothetical protein
MLEEYFKGGIDLDKIYKRLEILLKKDEGFGKIFEGVLDVKPKGVPLEIECVLRGGSNEFIFIGWIIEGDLMKRFDEESLERLRSSEYPTKVEFKEFLSSSVAFLKEKLTNHPQLAYEKYFENVRNDQQLFYLLTKIEGYDIITTLRPTNIEDVCSLDFLDKFWTFCSERIQFPLKERQDQRSRYWRYLRDLLNFAGKRNRQIVTEQVHREVRGYHHIVYENLSRILKEWSLQIYNNFDPIIEYIISIDNSSEKRLQEGELMELISRLYLLNFGREEVPDINQKMEIVMRLYSNRISKENKGAERAEILKSILLEFFPIDFTLEEEKGLAREYKEKEREERPNTYYCEIKFTGTIKKTLEAERHWEKDMEDLVLMQLKDEFEEIEAYEHLSDFTYEGFNPENWEVKWRGEREKSLLLKLKELFKSLHKYKFFKSILLEFFPIDFTLEEKEREERPNTYYCEIKFTGTIKKTLEAERHWEKDMEDLVLMQLKDEFEEIEDPSDFTYEGFNPYEHLSDFTYEGFNPENWEVKWRGGNDYSLLLKLKELFKSLHKYKFWIDKYQLQRKIVQIVSSWEYTSSGDMIDIGFIRKELGVLYEKDIIVEIIEELLKEGYLGWKDGRYDRVLITTQKGRSLLD